MVNERFRSGEKSSAAECHSSLPCTLEARLEGLLEGRLGSVSSTSGVGRFRSTKYKGRISVEEGRGFFCFEVGVVGLAGVVPPKLADRSFDCCPKGKRSGTAVEDLGLAGDVCLEAMSVREVGDSGLEIGSAGRSSTATSWSCCTSRDCESGSGEDSMTVFLSSSSGKALESSRLTSGADFTPLSGAESTAPAEAGVPMSCSVLACAGAEESC